MHSDLAKRSDVVAFSIAERLRETLISLFVFAFLISLPVYLYLTGLSGVAPRYIFLISIVFVLFCNVNVTYRSIYNVLPFVSWHAAYLLIVTFSYVVFADSRWGEPGAVTLWGRTFVALWVIVIGASLASDKLMRIIAASAASTSVICLVDIAFPSLLYKEIVFDDELTYVGRAMGLFLQPNGAASAMALGFLAAHSEIDKRWFYAFFVIIVLGLLATLSRGALLCFLATLPLVKFPKLIVSNKFKLGVGFIAILLLALSYVLPIDWREFGTAADLWVNLIGIRALGLGGDIVDFAALERLDAARKAWDTFAEFPWLGSGIGYTRHWDFGVPSHNMYLAFAAELGVGGLMFLLLYFVVVYYSVPIRYRYNTRLVLVFLSLFFFFTHYYFDDYAALLIVGVLVGASLRSAHPSRDRAG